jgi:ABC-type sugar transport system substrate-binding protein
VSYLDDELTRRLLLRRGLTTLGAGMVGGSLLAACGDDADKNKASADSGAKTPAAGDGMPGKGKTIGVTLIGINEYVLGAATGVIKELEAGGYDVKLLSSNFTPDGEIKNFQTFVSQGVDGIITLPVTSASAARGALNAEKSSIPTVSLAWASESPADDILVGRVRLNNVTGGKKIAEWLSQNADPGEVLLVQGFPGNEFSDDFDKGLAQGLAEVGGGWKIVGKVPGQYLRDKAITAAQNLTTAHPKARVIVTSVAEMGVGVASYLQRKGAKNYTHVTSDGNTEMIDWMDKGFISADRYFSSATSGEMGAKMMRAHLESDKVTPPTDIPESMETPDTIKAKVDQEPLVFQEHLAEAKKAA